MGRPEHLTIDITGSHNEVLFTLRVVDNITALIGPDNNRSNTVDILEPREEQQPLRTNHPWDAEIALPQETKGLTPEEAAAEVVNRMQKPVLEAILKSQKYWRSV